MTGYPRIGHGELHIAHLLWGGLFMLVALVLLFAVLGKRTKRLAAMIGGIGFGLFIDELGKFVTADNDYLFQPAIALIYVVFIILFLAFRAIERRALSRDEALVNAADMVREVILGGASPAESARALRLLARSEARGPLAEALREAICSAEAMPNQTPSILARWAAWSWQLYDRLTGWAWYQRAVVIVLLGQAVLGVLANVTDVDSRMPSMIAAPGGAPAGDAGVLASIVSAAFVAVGVSRIRGSRVAAYRWFERSVLVAIFFTQVLMFWQDQFRAVGGLVWNLVLLSALRYIIRQEDARQVLSR
jgi:hypothetical protein